MAIKTLKNCTLEQFTTALIRGNGFGYETAWIKDLFKNIPFGIVEKHISAYEHNTCQHIMTEFFEKKLSYKKINETFYDESGEIAVTYESLETDSKVYKKVYKNAFVVYQKDDEIICVSINKFSIKEIVYRIYAPLGQDSLLSAWQEYAREFNLYKNKKITADCEFLDIANVSWKDIILDAKTISVVRTNISEIFEYGDYLRANNLSFKRGVILSGPPGTGKTMLAKVISKEVAGTVIYALPSHLERSSDISRVCEMAKDLSPCILIIEDIDWIAENRDESVNAGAVIQLMNYLDGLQEFTDVVTIATTNNVEKIEEAIKNRPGRFDRVINIPIPDDDCRLRMLQQFIGNFRIENIDFARIVKITKKLSGAHMKDLVRTAAMFAIKTKSVDDHKKVIIKQSHFESALAEICNIDYSQAQKLQNKGKKVGFLHDEDY